jgi:hypothetical protein
MDNLPFEIQDRIINYLPTPDIQSYRQVNPTSRDISERILRQRNPLTALPFVLIEQPYMVENKPIYYGLNKQYKNLINLVENGTVKLKHVNYNTTTGEVYIEWTSSNNEGNITGYIHDNRIDSKWTVTEYEKINGKKDKTLDIYKFSIDQPNPYIHKNRYESENMINNDDDDHFRRIYQEIGFNKSFKKNGIFELYVNNMFIIGGLFHNDNKVGKWFESQIPSYSYEDVPQYIVIYNNLGERLNSKRTKWYGYENPLI